MDETTAPPAPPATSRVALRRAPTKGRHDAAAVHGVLDATPHCHLAWVLDDGWPMVVPTLQARIGGHAYLHGSTGSRPALAGPGTPVCLTATVLDGLVLARSGFHHSANHRSVVVLGRLELVTDADERLAALERITDLVVPGRWAELRPPSERELTATVVLRLPLDEASAKVRSGPPVDEPSDHGNGTWAGVVPTHVAYGVPQPDPQLERGVVVPASVRRLLGDRPDGAPRGRGGRPPRRPDAGRARA